MCVIITRAESPGKAANRLIQQGRVKTDRALVVAIPTNREIDYLPYYGLKLSKDDIKSLFPNEQFSETFLNERLDNVRGSEL